MAGEDLDPVGQLQKTLQALVELTRSVDRRDRQVRPGGVADEERIACEDEPGLFGPAAIDDREAAVLGAMARGVEHPQRDVAEHDLLSVLERVVLVRGFRGRVDGDRDPVLDGQRDKMGIVNQTARDPTLPEHPLQQSRMTGRLAQQTHHRRREKVPDGL